MAAGRNTRRVSSPTSAIDATITANTANDAGRQGAGGQRSGEARAERDAEQRLLEQRIRMPRDRGQDEERVDHAHHGSLDEHRQAAGEGRRALVGVERHRLALQALAIVAVPALELGELRCEPGAGALGLRLRDADGDQRGAHEQRDQHDGGRGARHPHERLQQVGERHEHGVGAVEQGGDGREGVEVHWVPCGRRDAWSVWPRGRRTASSIRGGRQSMDVATRPGCRVQAPSGARDRVRRGRSGRAVATGRRSAGTASTRRSGLPRRVAGGIAHAVTTTASGGGADDAERGGP